MLLLASTIQLQDMTGNGVIGKDGNEKDSARIREDSHGDGDRPSGGGDVGNNATTHAVKDQQATPFASAHQQISISRRQRQRHQKPHWWRAQVPALLQPRDSLQLVQLAIAAPNHRSWPSIPPSFQQPTRGQCRHTGVSARRQRRHCE